MKDFIHCNKYYILKYILSHLRLFFLSEWSHGASVVPFAVVYFKIKLLA